MKLINLTQGHHALVDDSDYEYLNQWKWLTKTTRKGFCARRCENRGTRRVWIWMHRLILNPPIGMVVDHINHNGLDNQRANLRIATNQQNTFNSGKKKQNTSGFKGVTFCKFSGKWKAQIEISGINKHLGRFTSREDAKAAYDEVAKAMHGEFVCL